MASKSATIMARIEPDIKEKAESILSDLGISASTAINIFYRQIIESNGLPFRPAKVSHQPPDSYEDLTDEQLSWRLAEGYRQIKAGNYMPAEEYFEKLTGELSNG